MRKKPSGGSSQPPRTGRVKLLTLGQMQQWCYVPRGSPNIKGVGVPVRHFHDKPLNITAKFS